MKFEEKLHNRIGRETGFKVPEGYFEDVVARTMSRLPERETPKAAPKLSSWKRVMPYLTLAAMFLGIWCMMKVFHTVSDPENVSLENPPTTIAAVMEDYVSQTEPLPQTDVTDISLIDEVSDQYTSIEEFEADFNYQLDPSYADMRI